MNVKTILSGGMLVVGLLFVAGCADEKTEPIAQDGEQQTRTYEEVKGEGAVFRQVSACELFSWLGPIGVFTVDTITGTYSAETGPKIHVQLEQEELLAGTLPTPFIFSFSGGEDDEGITLGPDLSARVGERVVILVHENGLTVDTELQIFREIAPDKFSNGQLFAENGLTVAELMDIVQGVRGNTVCPYGDDFGF